MFGGDETLPSASRSHVLLAEPLKDWEDLAADYKTLESQHVEYKSLLANYLEAQRKCMSAIKRQNYRMSNIRMLLKNLSDVDSDEKKACLLKLQKNLDRHEAQLTKMSAAYPRESGRYLQIILGSVNVSILDTQTRINYKVQYETFKLYVTVISCALAFLCLAFDNRILDLAFLFLCVWYYCTLTIRESILRVNGSRIRGWWRAHHFIATVAVGILLIWPDGQCFRQFRSQLMWFSLYISFLQYLQFFYQRGCLYKLRSLGERKSDMDITINGFLSWMWKGLAFVLPFLFLGYIFQMYNAYTLHHLSTTTCSTWHVSILSLLFAIMAIGNMITTLATIPSKFGEKQRGLLRNRFVPLDITFWTESARQISRSDMSNIPTEIDSDQNPCTESDTAATRGNTEGFRHRRH